MSDPFSYPLFGSSIQCPHCHQSIAALILTDTYLCQRHGAFEVDPSTQALVHLQSGRRWRRWQEQWFRQHTHADGIRFEIHEELDRLHSQGIRATQVIIAGRYRDLLNPHLEPFAFRRQTQQKPRLYGLPVMFSSDLSELDPPDSPRWQVINFELVTEADPTLRQPRYQLCE